MTDAELLALVARAADLCLEPLRHGVRISGDASATTETPADHHDCCLLIEARDAAGSRRPEADLELEIYRSGRELHVMLARPGQDQAPVLWHGQHPVWMAAASGERCGRPADGAPLEALCRRLRALLGPGDQT